MRPVMGVASLAALLPPHNSIYSQLSLAADMQIYKFTHMKYQFISYQLFICKNNFNVQFSVFFLVSGWILTLVEIKGTNLTN